MAERQTAPDLSGIRGDHVGRYKFAAERVSGRVLDAACGVGYGSKILADAGCRVRAVDRSGAAIEYANTHYSHENIDYVQADVLTATGFFDWVVSFETVEHLQEDGALLRRFSGMAPKLLVSVPNESVLKYTKQRFPYHVRHYTPGELEAVLRGSGWNPVHWWSQLTTGEKVTPGTRGRTLIVEAHA